MLEVTVRASDTAGRYIRAASVTAEFWGPGRDTSGPPDHQVPAEWDERSRGWLAIADATGWEPGRWIMRGHVAGQAATGWTWKQFQIPAEQAPAGAQGADLARGTGLPW